jgi:hypothetical protein
MAVRETFASALPRCRTLRSRTVAQGVFSYDQLNDHLRSFRRVSSAVVDVDIDSLVNNETVTVDAVCVISMATRIGCRCRTSEHEYVDTSVPRHVPASNGTPVSLRTSGRRQRQRSYARISSAMLSIASGDSTDEETESDGFPSRVQFGTDTVTRTTIFIVIDFDMALLQRSG